MKKDDMRGSFASGNIGTVIILFIMLIFTLIFTGCAGDKKETNNEIEEQTASIDTEKTVYVVAKDGSGDFTTIHEALEKVPTSYDRRIKIFIKNGTYDEDLITNFRVKK